MPKPLIAQTPYPSVKDLSCDPVAARILTPAYATSCGELNSTLQYIYQSFVFNHAGDEQTAELLKSIAIAEMIHIDLLGNALINLGAQPIFTFQPPVPFNFYSTKFVAYSNRFTAMLEDDIVAEKHAIESYKKMLSRLKNERVAQLVSRLIEDEELHLKAFTEARAQYCGSVDKGRK